MRGYEQGYEDCRHYAHDYYKPKWHDIRKNHKLTEWHSFLKWVESLPYAEELIVNLI